MFGSVNKLAFAAFEGEVSVVETLVYAVCTVQYVAFERFWDELKTFVAVPSINSPLAASVAGS